MLNKSTAEQLEIMTQIKSNTQDLRDRFEDDYSLFRLDKFQIPSVEGVWESFTTNGPAVLGDSVVNALSEARLKLWIPIGADDKAQRSTLSLTEQLANGAIWMANRDITAIPEGIDIQSELSFHASKRGVTALRCFLREDDDGRLIADIAVWDPLNTFWISGSKGFLWVMYKRYGSKKQLEDEYEGDLGEADEHGRVAVYNVLDRDEEGVFSGTEWITKEKHGLKYIPVFIRPSGSTPIIQSDRYTDTIKDWGESVISRNRNLYPIESRLLSYGLTRAGKAAKMPKVILYDSRMGPVPPEFDKDPDVKGRVIFLDIAKGQDMKEFVPQPSNADILQMQAFTSGQISLGGVPPIALGHSDRTQTASATSQLMEAARQTAKPFKKNVESCFEWLAEEIVRQYKNGDFKETQIEGYDQKGKKFKVDVSPDKIDDNWHFEAELKLNMLRDEIGMMGLASESIKSGILSKQTARDKFTDIDDTDQEQEIINREQAEEITNVKLWDLLGALIDDRGRGKGGVNDLTIMAVMNQIMVSSGIQPQDGGGTTAESGAIQAEPQTDANRINRQGLDSIVDQLNSRG